MKINNNAPALQTDLAYSFTELCKWLEDGHLISDILQRLMQFDINQLELLCQNARAEEKRPLFIGVSLQSLVVIEEYCALARVQDRVCAAAQSA